MGVRASVERRSTNTSEPFAPTEKMAIEFEASRLVAYKKRLSGDKHIYSAPILPVKIPGRA